MRNLDLPQILYQPFAATGDKNTILDSPSTTSPQRASLQAGFPPITQIPIDNGGIPPERMDFNGLGYLLSSFYFFTQCGGVYTFNRNVSNAIGGYPLGAVLYYTDSDGTTYKVRSLLENNTFDFVTTPSYIDDEHWAYVSSTPITQDTSASSASNVFSTAAAQSLISSKISDTLSAIYPVGSIYIGTQNTCPLASLISGSQWELVSTSLITDVNNTASLSVYGNGNAIGVYSDNIGVGGLTSHGDYGSVGIKVGNYNTTANGSASRVGWNHGVALSTNASTSGITGTANISSTKLTINVWRRTA